MWAGEATTLLSIEGLTPALLSKLLAVATMFPKEFAWLTDSVLAQKGYPLRQPRFWSGVGFFNTNLSIFFGTCLGSVWRSDQGSFHISSSRVYLLLACQELLKCVWPPMNQRRIADHRKLYRQNNQLPNKMPAELEGKLNILDSFGGGCHLEQLNEAIQGKLKSQTRTFSRI